MQKLINKPENLAQETLEALVLSQPELLELRDNLVINRALATAQRVAIVTLGAAGHEPAFAGFVGEGLLDIAVVGDIFAAPGPQSCFEALQLADRGRGVLLIVLNQTGYRLAAELAVRQARKQGLQVELLLVCDEALPGVVAEERSGLLGCLPLYKLAGAAAAEGRSLTEVAALCRRLATTMATTTLLTEAGSEPLSGAPPCELPAGQLKLGAGLEGEGGETQSLTTASDAAALVVERLLQALALPEGARLLLVVSGSGATTLAEQLLVFRSCQQLLEAQGLEVAARAVGNFLTLQDSAGVQVCVAQLDDELLRYWQAPCRTAYYRS